MKYFPAAARKAAILACLFTGLLNTRSPLQGQSVEELDMAVRDAYTTFINSVQTLAQQNEAGNASYNLESAIAKEYRLLDDKWKDACAVVARSSRRGLVTTAAIDTAANWMLNCKTVDRDVAAALKHAVPLPMYDTTLVDAVRKHLATRPKQTVLVQYFYYIEIHDFALDDNNQPSEQLVASDLAAAWLIPPTGSGDVTLVHLHEFDSVNTDDDVNHLRAAISQLRRRIARDEQTIKSDARLGWDSLNDFIRATERLRHILLDPLDTQGAIYSFDHWIISPVADLWLVPFSAMPLPRAHRISPADFYCVERFEISYSLSGKYLVHPPATNSQSDLRKPIVLSSPEFLPSGSAGNVDSDVQRTTAFMSPVHHSAGPQQHVATASAAAEVCGPQRYQNAQRLRGPQLCFPTRPKSCPDDDIANEGTLGSGLEDEFEPLSPEFDVLAQSIAQSVGLRGNNNILLRGDATESKFVAAMDRSGGDQYKSISVIMTHGFFLFDGWYQMDSKYPNAEDPLMRVGLALAGAESTRRSGELFVSNASDGILYGREIAQLRLDGQHDTVVVIACQSGVGEVFGGTLATLRQSFLLAGARKVVATSWTVSAKYSRWFVRHLFREIGEEGTLRYAHLHEAQLRTIEELSRGYGTHGVAHPIYWAAFSLTGHAE